MDKAIKQIIKSRNKLPPSPYSYKSKFEQEGGCGVTGFACNIPVSGRHIFEPSIQMHNRGNGKGGGIAAVGLKAEDLGVNQEILENDYLYQIALLNNEVQKQLEEEFIKPLFKIDNAERVKTVADYRDIPGLVVKPPEKKAFVLSHGRNMLIFKIVGYAEQVVQYYQLEDLKAHVWIAHQRYPTKGKVWHPAGAHPFVGMDEALVHNGDFANYYAVTQYLKQRNIFPLFLTDTEVSVLLFDLLNRVYGYPLEYIIEAMAPTTELDFALLPPEKQKIYSAIHACHIHGSPDGPWFFIIARNEPYKNYFQLIGITDTAMLRPQVFALYEGEVQIGLICSEKQAIDATLRSLSKEDKRFCPVADQYWNARGGSHTDGGAFIFTVKPKKDDPSQKVIICTDKFGRVVSIPKKEIPPKGISLTTSNFLEKIELKINATLPIKAFKEILPLIPKWDYEEFYGLCHKLANRAIEDERTKKWIIEFLTLLNDRRYALGKSMMS